MNEIAENIPIIEPEFHGFIVYKRIFPKKRGRFNICIPWKISFGPRDSVRERITAILSAIFEGPLTLSILNLKESKLKNTIFQITLYFDRLMLKLAGY